MRNPLERGLASRGMGYELGNDKLDPAVKITSETRVGLNEEIDRFNKEEQPRKIWYESGNLAPNYRNGEWIIQLRYKPLKNPWSES